MKYCCSPKVIIPAIILLVLVFISPLRSQVLAYLPFVVLLACPVMCVVMMMFMMKGTGSDKKSFVCPECGYRYEEEKWAKQCEAWCKEHHSCNLEIIQHGTPTA